MTIPIQAPQIHPQFVQNQQTPGLEILARALQQRKELEMARQDLQRRQQEFDLSKRIGEAGIARSEAETARIKAELKEKADNIAAQDTALGLFQGNLLRLDDAKGVGEFVASSKELRNPRVSEHFYSYLKDHFAFVNSITPNQEIRVAPGPTATGFEFVGIDPKTLKTRGTGRAAANPNAPIGRLPVLGEREKATVAIMTAQANRTINRLETADPTVPERLAQRLRNSRAITGTVGKRLMGMSADDIAIIQEQQIEQSLQDDPVLLEYYQAQKAYLGPTLFGLSGKVVTGRDYTTQAPTFFAMGASNPATLAARRKARADRTRGFAVEAGDAMTERLSELPDPEEYGFAPLQQSPGTTVTPTGRKRRPENPYR